MNNIVRMPLIVFLLFTPLISFADIIYFKSGKIVKTPKVWAEGNMVKCILYGGEVSFHPRDIERVERTELPKLAVTDNKEKEQPESNPARALAQEAYELAASHPSGGPAMSRVHSLLDEARAIDPEEAEIFLVEMIRILQQGHIIGTWYNSSSYLPGTIEQATQLARQAVEADPQYAKGYAMLAWMMIAGENYAEAERLLEKSGSLDSGSEYYWLYKGTLLMVTKRYSEARHAYDTAMTHTLSPLQLEILKGRKRDLAKLSGDVEEALRLYQEDIDANPDNAYAWGDYGTYLVCLGRFEEAIPYLSRAIEIYPYPLAMQFLAYAKMNSTDAAKCREASQSSQTAI